LTDGGAAATIASDSAQLSGPDEPLHFEEHIKPLFRERDRDSMRFAFDLWSVDDVSTHADAILDRVEAGTMPCERSMARGARRRLPPVDRRRQTRIRRRQAPHRSRAFPKAADGIRTHDLLHGKQTL
jgi:hypothetical protein